MVILSCQAILFDLDGTLIESTFYIERLWQDWGLRHGVTPQHMSEVMHGRRGVEIIGIVAPHLSIPEEVSALETAEILNMNDMKAYPGAKELLSVLPRQQWAIATSGSRRVASARLNHAQLPTPEVFITADDVTAGKPAPDAYLLAASRLNVKPAECIVVEDSPAGVQAAKSAGMKVIGIASTQPRRQLNKADVIAQSLTDIKVQIAGNQISLQIQ